MATAEHLELSTYIKSVHQKLRDDTQILGVEKAWRKHCDSKTNLRKYAWAMQELATKHWERNYNKKMPEMVMHREGRRRRCGEAAMCRVQWIHAFCQSYFYDDGGVNERRRQRAKEMEIAAKIPEISLLSANTADLLSPPAIEDIIRDDESGQTSVIKLLDVGSCYNPFKNFDCYDVTAIDIAPANNDVLMCDFLNVHLLDCISTGTPSTGTLSTGTPSIPTTGTPSIPTNGTPSTGTSSTGTPNTGIPSTGTPSTGTPSTGTSSTGSPSTGTPNIPTTGTPSTVAPSTGTPSTGYARSNFDTTSVAIGTGTSSTGSSTDTGTPSTGTPSTGTLSTGTPSIPTTGTPSIPTNGTPSTSTSSTGTPNTGIPSTGTPSTGTPSTGTSSTGSPSTGTPNIPTTGTPSTVAPSTGTPSTGYARSNFDTTSAAIGTGTSSTGSSTDTGTAGTDTTSINSPCAPPHDDAAIPPAELTALQKASYDVVVFSLFLEYLPASQQRLACCQKAYALLRPEGLLMVITPDSKHVGANARYMKSWRCVLAQLGFSRIKYEKWPHMHCMAFRKSLRREIAARWADIYRNDQMFDGIVIPQDFNKAMMMSETQSQYCDL